MLKLRYRRLQPATAPVRSLADRQDLKIRNLLDDPALRAAMGLADGEEPPALQGGWPAPLFDRRRLLQSEAA